jgi:hypothetical protein
MTHAIVTFRIPVAAYGALLERTKVVLHETQWERDGAWKESGYVHGPLVEAVRTALATDPASAGTVVETDETADFEIGFTRAAKEYDWFGTLHLETCADDVRMVALRRENAGMQKGRYESGCKPFVNLADAPSYFGAMPVPVPRRLRQQPLFDGVEPEPPKPRPKQLELIPEPPGHTRPRVAHRSEEAPQAPASTRQTAIVLPGDQTTLPGT